MGTGNFSFTCVGWHCRAIYIELYYIFASVWAHKIYTIYSILFIVFISLIIVTVFVTANTYIFGADPSFVFIFFYCICYYRARSDMSGFMQTSFSFGYMTCICCGFFLMLGAVGFY
ncbi:unnamed protein product, partial [Musa acuminata var. zebrina]